MPPKTAPELVQILSSAARSPIGAAFASAVAEVKRAVIGKTVAPAGFETLFMARPTFNADAVKQLFAPQTDAFVYLQSPIRDFLIWVAISCGKAAGKTVVSDAYVGVIGSSVPLPQLDPNVAQSDALLFVNYTSNGNDTTASFAISKPRQSLSPDGSTEAAWTVFSKTEPSIAYMERIRAMSGDKDAAVLWVPAIYGSLASLVNDILAHLVYDGRPPSYALWYGGEVPRALAMAGLHALGDRKVFATIELLNVCGYGGNRRKPAILVNPNAPIALPPSKSVADFMAMYPAPVQKSGEPVLKKRTKTSVWATSVEKSLKTWKYQGRAKRATLENLLTMIANADSNAYRFFYENQGENGWTAADVLEDVSYALLSLTLNVELGDGAKIKKDAVVYGLLTNFKTVFSKIAKTLPNRDGLQNTISSALFYGMFFELLSSNDKLDDDPYKQLRENDKSEFMYTAMMYGLDQFVDLGGYETALGHAFSEKDVVMSKEQRTENGMSDVLNAVQEFIVEHSGSIGSREGDGKPFQTIGGLFSNASASLDAKDEMLHAVFRIVTFSAFLMVLSASAPAGVTKPIVAMVWSGTGERNPVPRMGHFWVRNKISGGRRGSTTAAAALVALRAFGKSDTPTENTVVNSLPAAVRTSAAQQKQNPQPVPQQPQQPRSTPSQPQPRPSIPSVPYQQPQPSRTPAPSPAGGQGTQLTPAEMTKLVGGVITKMTNLRELVNVLSELFDHKDDDDIKDQLQEKADFNDTSAKDAAEEAAAGIDDVRRVLIALQKM